MAPSSPVASKNSLATHETLVLDAFIPKPLTNLATEHERGTIETILAYGDKLLLGLSTGALHVYTVGDPFGESPQATVSKVYKTFSTRPIEKLGLLKDAGCLVVLAEGIVSVFDIETYSLDEKLIKTKGATTFAITSGVRHLGEDSISVMISRLLVACKTRLVCYEWRDSEFTEYKELHLPDRIKTISFINPDKAVCGLASDYCIVDVPTSNVSNIVLPGSHNASFTSLGMSYIGIGGRQPTPHSVMLPNETALLVKDIMSQVIDSNGQLMDKPSIPWTVAPEALGCSYPYLICILPKHIEIRNPDTFTLLQTLPIPGVRCVNDGKLAYVSTSTQVYRLLCTDFKNQISALAEQESQLTEAISLLTLIDPAFIEHKESLLRELQIKRAIQMFKKKEYLRAMLLFSDISAPPKTVIELFPPQISGTAEDLIEATEQLSNEASSTVGTPARRSSISSQSRTLGAIPGPTMRKQSPSEDVSSDDTTESLDPSSQTPAWTDKDLALAIRSLLNFLADTRRKISSLSTSKEPILFQGFELSKDIYGDLEEAATLVDTTLFKCYIIRSPALVGPLLRIHNHCESSIVKTVLSKAGKWRELIDFYFAKQLHKDALDLLHSLGTTTTEQASELYLEGPEPTVRYLQRLDNNYIDLIFEFATWPISVKEEYGVELFLDDSTESESLDRGLVLKYLETTSPSLTIQYLEHIIHEKKDESPQFHTALAIAYIKFLSQPESDQHEDVFTKLSTLLKAIPSYYRIERVLSSLPKKATSDLLLEVKAILCGKRGQHKQALEIITFEIGDSTKARVYCSDLYEQDAAAGRGALHSLMALYLTPPEKHMPRRLDLALELLSSQGSRMSVVEIINTLPNATSVQDLVVFLTSQIRTLEKSWNNSELDASLRKVHLVKTQETLLSQQQRSVTITNLKTCRVCFKRLGHSVISVFPNGTAIHYGCARAYQQMLDEEANKGKEVKKRNVKSVSNGLKTKPSLTNVS